MTLHVKGYNITERVTVAQIIIPSHGSIGSTSSHEQININTNIQQTTCTNTPELLRKSGVKLSSCCPTRSRPPTSFPPHPHQSSCLPRISSPLSPPSLLSYCKSSPITLPIRHLHEHPIDRDLASTLFPRDSPQHLPKTLQFPTFHLETSKRALPSLIPTVPLPTELLTRFPSKRAKTMR